MLCCCCFFSHKNSPAQLQGNFIDVIARKALWDNGLDYAHGTGHGIGHFLNVHEGPMGIGMYSSKPDDPGLQANMFVSDGKIKMARLFL